MIIEYYPFALLNISGARATYQYINAFGNILRIYNEIEEKLIENKVQYNWKKIEDILVDNNRYRKELRNKYSSESKINCEKAKKELYECVDFICRSLDKYLRNSVIESVELPDKYIYGQRIFTQKFFNNLIKHKFILKNLYYGEYPISFASYFFFRNNIKAEHTNAIENRNKIIAEYVKFINNYAKGKSLYYPWWLINNWKWKIKEILYQRKIA